MGAYGGAEWGRRLLLLAVRPSQDAFSRCLNAKSDEGRAGLPRELLQNATILHHLRVAVAFVNTKPCQAPQRWVTTPNPLKTKGELSSYTSVRNPKNVL